MLLAVTLNPSLPSITRLLKSSVFANIMQSAEKRLYGDRWERGIKKNVERGEEKKAALPYHPFSFDKLHMQIARGGIFFLRKVHERASRDPGHNPSAPACTSEEQELGHKRGSHVNPLLQDQCKHVNSAVLPPTAAPGSVFLHARRL